MISTSSLSATDAAEQAASALAMAGAARAEAAAFEDNLKACPHKILRSQHAAGGKAFT
jgi:hypothetical protein